MVGRLLAAVAAIMGGALLASLFFYDALPVGLRTIADAVGIGRKDKPALSAAPIARQTPPPRARARCRGGSETRPPAATSEVIDIDVSLPPFPTARELRADMSETEILARFGAPDCVARWSESGLLNEKLVYQSSDSETSILLKGGRLVSSQTERVPF